ncbi:hypothetical protein BACT_0690 [Bifidobacterium actinocoloniiforme DSM 22766]|uniref:Uncharacterized protein n=1 Tax=Bifidobacterium actinocoloniiforme DSM 22766 TaxID=1437605 RepID=A0A086Z0D9_9BIFI|nr:hypothetical protein [Bifidobacterium actinocoloniiforme]AKV55232.1 hypothetical protein AB656_02070 [Bifidobacterium actinocoloniiforme DSM 22766]KFI39989.1 hypothetical protein BACT_0690 [Bifidobacterium actinocoloniiforme DSM 22766]
MPWWIWLAIVILMIVMLVSGGIYVFRRARSAAHVVGSLVAASSQRLGPSRLQAPERPEQDPAFTEPLSTSADRYASAHAKVLERKEAARERHNDTWKSWQTFND